MKKITMRFVAAAIVAAVVLLATVFLLKGENQEVENVVRAYNNTLMQAYISLKPSMMQNLASQREQSKIDNYMAYLLKNNRVLKCEIREVEFQDIRMHGTAARVLTRERWVYQYLDPVNRKPVSDTYDVYYGNTYTLKKEAGHWIVDDLESKEIGGKTEG